MNKVKLFIFLLPVFLGSQVLGSDTLYCRFNNFVVVDGTPNDTLIFNVEFRSSTTGTYLTAYQLDIQYNTTVFGSSILPVFYDELNLVGPGMSVPIGPVTTSNNNRFRCGNGPLLPPFTPGNFVMVPTTSWGKLCKVKMLIVNTSQNCGVEFALSFMAGQEKFIKTQTSSMSNYAPVIAANNLASFPPTPSLYNLMLSELADPSDSGADFVEIYNPGPNNVDLSIYPWYLTRYNGSTYENVRLTGTLNSGKTYVVAGSSFAAAYPGKTANKTASFIENGGTVSYYLSIFGEYNVGTTKDIYNGTTLPFTGKHAVRPFTLTSPNTTFTTSEWNATSAATIDMTPGSHRATLTWDGSVDGDWRDTTNWTRSYVPDIGHDVQIPDGVSIVPVISPGNMANCHDIHVDGAPPE